VTFGPATKPSSDTDSSKYTIPIQVLHDLRDMAGERWVMDHPTCPFYRQTLAMCQAAGFQPDVMANTESVSVATALVRSGAGIAILPSLALAGITDLAIRPITPAVTGRPYAVLRREAHLRPSIATALELLADTATSVGGTVAASASPHRPPGPSHRSRPGELGTPWCRRHAVGATTRTQLRSAAVPGRWRRPEVEAGSYRPGLERWRAAYAEVRRSASSLTPASEVGTERLLDTVVDQILMESRACIQPYLVAPTVRTRPGSRRRTGIEPA
jgi:hypothetical protein